MSGCRYKRLEGVVHTTGSAGGFDFQIDLPKSYFVISTAHALSVSPLAEALKRRPSVTLAFGASARRLAEESPMPLPPEVANGTIVFPASASAFDSMKVSMIDGSRYHQIGKPTNTVL